MSRNRHSLLLPEPHHIEFLPDRAFAAPDREQRRSNLLTGRSRRRKKTRVDSGRCALVLAHRMDRGWLAIGSDIGRESFLRHRARCLALDRKMAFHIIAR